MKYLSKKLSLYPLFWIWRSSWHRPFGNACRHTKHFRQETLFIIRREEFSQQYCKTNEHVHFRNSTYRSSSWKLNCKGYSDTGRTLLLISENYFLSAPHKYLASWTTTVIIALWTLRTRRISLLVIPLSINHLQNNEGSYITFPVDCISCLHHESFSFFILFRWRFRNVVSINWLSIIPLIYPINKSLWNNVRTDKISSNTC